MEEELRKAVAVISQRVEYADAAVLLYVLKRKPLTTTCKELKLERRQAAQAIRRVLGALEEAKGVIKHADALKEVRKEIRRTAAKLVEVLATSLEKLDAPILLGLLKGEGLADIAKASKLNSRQTAHARLKGLIERLPWVKALHIHGAKA